MTEPTSKVVVHRVQCAAITRGCLNSLMWESRSREIDEAGHHLLALNGWHLDHDRWVCGNHESAEAVQS